MPAQLPHSTKRSFSGKCFVPMKQIKHILIMTALPITHSMAPGAHWTTGRGKGCVPSRSCFFHFLLPQFRHLHNEAPCFPISTCDFLAWPLGGKGSPPWAVEQTLLCGSLVGSLVQQAFHTWQGLGPRAE